MPRNVRNFWIELRVDGKKTRIATGPRNSSGGFSLEIKMRDRGAVSHGVDVRGFVDPQGQLHLTCEDRERSKNFFTKSKDR